MLLRCHRSLCCRYPWRATIRQLCDDGDNERRIRLTMNAACDSAIVLATMAGQIITFAAMARQMIAFAAMAGQMITFAAMAGQIITFASMPATNVWVVDDYQTRASISKISWRVGFIQNVMPPNILGPVRLGSPNRWISGPDDSDGKGEIYVECDSVVVCELLLGLRPWHLKSDYWYTIVCDCVGWCRCDEAGLVMMSLLVGRNRDKAICILAWQLTKVAAMAYVFCFSDGLPF
ncbi:hypothetical protein Tco_1268060 [Tanacetum coccineum]